MRFSILNRLLIWLLIPLCALVLAAGGVSYWTARNALFRSFDQQLFTQAEALASLTEIEDGGVLFEPGEDGMQQAWESKFTRTYYQAWLSNGDTIYRSNSLTENLVRPPLFTSRPVIWNVVLPDGHAGRAIAYAFTPVLDDPSTPLPLGADRIEIVVAEDLNALYETLFQIRSSLAGTFAFLILAGVGVIRFGLKKGLIPLGFVASKVDCIDAGKLDMRFDLRQVPIEVRPLCSRLNELLERLHGSFERERRFSADAAHELRTPVTELRTLAEVELGQSENLSDENRQAFQDVLDIARQLEGIIEGLLLLTRCDGRAREIETDTIDLAAEIRTIWQPLSEFTTKREIKVELQLPAHLQCVGNRAALQLILRNVLSNAAEYTPPQGRIEILGANGDGASSWEVTIANSTVGVQSEHIAHFHERFWRLDSARSSSFHSGLGLSVAHGLADRHGLKIRTSLSPEQLLSVSLSHA